MDDDGDGGGGGNWGGIINGRHTSMAIVGDGCDDSGSTATFNGSTGGGGGCGTGGSGGEGVDVITSSPIGQTMLIVGVVPYGDIVAVVVAVGAAGDVFVEINSTVVVEAPVVNVVITDGAVL